MRWFTIYILFLSVLGFTKKISAQETSAQDDYVNSIQEKHNFNKKKWGNLKDRITKESGGVYSTENGATEGSYYNYDNEDYDRNNSDYKNEEDQYIYDENQSYSEDNWAKNEGNGGVNYHPKKDDSEYGQQDYHPKKKQFQRANRNNISVSPEGSMGLLQYVLFALLTVLLAFLIYQLFMKTSFDNKGAKVVDRFEELIPTETPKSKLELMLEQAIAKDDFRGAIRLYFIFIIKGLSEKEWIRWEKKKTNFSYLIEMRGKPQYDSFNTAVSIYELVWYGNYSVKKEDFISLEPKFKTLLNTLNSEGNK